MKSIADMRQEIVTLEWDIPNIADESLRAFKKRELERLKRELKTLKEGYYGRLGQGI